MKTIRALLASLNALVEQLSQLNTLLPRLAELHTRLAAFEAGDRHALNRTADAVVYLAKAERHARENAGLKTDL